MADRRIRVEHWVFGARMEDEHFESFDAAAVAAWMACDRNTSWYGLAVDLESGESLSRDELLDRGYNMVETGQGLGRF